jgi:hypothetical protein
MARYELFEERTSSIFGYSAHGGGVMVIGFRGPIRTSIVGGKNW